MQNHMMLTKHDNVTNFSRKELTIEMTKKFLEQQKESGLNDAYSYVTFTVITVANPINDSEK